MNESITKPAMNREGSRTLIRIALIALFAALTAAGAFIAIPIGPVPIVLQNLFALLSGLILGPLMGGASVGLYLLAGIRRVCPWPPRDGSRGKSRQEIAHEEAPCGTRETGYAADSPGKNRKIQDPRQKVKAHRGASHEGAQDEPREKGEKVLQNDGNRPYGDGDEGPGRGKGREKGNERNPEQ